MPDIDILVNILSLVQPSDIKSVFVLSTMNKERLLVYQHLSLLVLLVDK